MCVQVQKKVPLQRKMVDDVLGGDEAWTNVDQTDSTQMSIWNMSNMVSSALSILWTQ